MPSEVILISASEKRRLLAGAVAPRREPAEFELELGERESPRESVAEDYGVTAVLTTGEYWRRRYGRWWRRDGIPEPANYCGGDGSRIGRGDYSESMSGR